MKLDEFRKQLDEDDELYVNLDSKVAETSRQARMVGYPFAMHRGGQRRHTILVENDETGTVEYRSLYPDGSLGEVLDDWGYSS